MFLCSFPTAAPSCADGKPNHAFMVCLEHADKVCDNCPLSQCTLYYSHELEDLEAMRDAIAARMNDYDTWRSTFAPFFLHGTPTAAVSSDAEKIESTVSALPVVAKVPLETFEVSFLDF